MLILYNTVVKLLDLQNLLLMNNLINVVEYPTRI